MSHDKKSGRAEAKGGSAHDHRCVVVDIGLSVSRIDRPRQYGINRREQEASGGQRASYSRQAGHFDSDEGCSLHAFASESDPEPEAA